MRAKTVLADVGPGEGRVPRGRRTGASRRSSSSVSDGCPGLYEMVLSLSAKGLAHGGIDAHLAEVQGMKNSKRTISNIANEVMDGMPDHHLLAALRPH